MKYQLKNKIIVLVYILFSSLSSLAQEVSTFTGSGVAGNSDGSAEQASFNNPYGIVVDVNGYVYIGDAFNNKIRKISPSGVVSTFAGNGISGSSDGIGTEVSFNYPCGLAIDANGYVYVADTKNNKIRKISPNGIVSTFAGTGISGSSDGIGTVATFNNPYGIAVDINGYVYVADTYSQKIRKISPNGVVSTLAGKAISGSSDGIGTEASFKYPFGIAVDRTGNLYVADRDNKKIRKISPEGIVSTLAGNLSGGSTDGEGTQASFSNPYAVAVDNSGNLFVADFGNNKIRKISSTGVVSTFAGAGGVGSTDGIATQALFNNPIGIAVDSLNGNIYVVDRGNYKIRRISNGSITTGFEDLSNNPNSLNIYPNPTDGVLTIVTPESTKAVITNSLGEVVTTVALSEGKNSVNLTIGVGLYFVKINNKVTKLIVE